ncbi:cytochrome P450 [Desarmillaria tabescens]|uniref:Cytochrome P450 n=1 Tax=Armillaria tabescens TaxID=1929756 RepID=A0AA39NR52_ARMTA|nr:cytochrome P450 [Desarmillaria tabescens]KAK0470334.1 cytochrome P450 [Desarmillaria tabescens]
MEREWETWAEWGRKYGGTSSVTILGQTIIVLNSYTFAKELLDNRSANYSDRPYMTMPILCGWGDSVVILSYGPAFRIQRKLFHKTMGNLENLRQFYHIEEGQSQEFLKKILADPEHFVDNVASVVLRIAYGYALGNDDRLLVECKQVTEDFIQMTKFLVNKLPFLRHIPEWMPGAGFKIRAKEWKRNVQDITNEPFEWVKEQMAGGIAEPSFVSSQLEDGEDENAIKYAAVTMYAAGFDTTVVTTKVFFKTMALFPEVQVRIQAEIDSVTGGDRLPTLADRDKGLLPYTVATLYEVLRWHLPLTIGFPHRALEDDTYRGYFIPKGSIVAFSSWQMCRDPDLYPDPEVFDPTRFLGTSPQLDPRELVFGFGRRICPGRFLAEASVFVIMARVLAVFDIVNAVSVDGVPLKPSPVQLTGTVR